MNTINCTVTSPRNTTVYKNVERIVLPVESGQSEILPGYAESFIMLCAGELIIIRESAKSNRENIPIQGGELHIKDDQAVIIL